MDAARDWCRCTAAGHHCQAKLESMVDAIYNGKDVYERTVSTRAHSEGYRPLRAVWSLDTRRLARSQLSGCDSGYNMLLKERY